jgi:hypothetical protein
MNAASYCQQQAFSAVYTVFGKEHHTEALLYNPNNANALSGFIWSCSLIAGQQGSVKVEPSYSRRNSCTAVRIYCQAAFVVFFSCQA